MLLSGQLAASDGSPPAPPACSAGGGRKSRGPRGPPTIQAEGRTDAPRCPLSAPSRKQRPNSGEIGTHCPLFVFLRILYKGSKNPIHTLLRKILRSKFLMIRGVGVGGTRTQKTGPVTPPPPLPPLPQSPGTHTFSEVTRTPVRLGRGEGGSPPAHAQAPPRPCRSLPAPAAVPLERDHAGLCSPPNPFGGGLMAP